LRFVPFAEGFTGAFFADLTATAVRAGAGAGFAEVDFTGTDFAGADFAGAGAGFTGTGFAAAMGWAAGRDSA
jgi:uncharacterized protein YjbI with pentapeptide repeats